MIYINQKGKGQSSLFLWATSGQLIQNGLANRGLVAHWVKQGMGTGEPWRQRRCWPIPAIPGGEANRVGRGGKRHQGDSNLGSSVARDSPRRDLCHTLVLRIEPKPPYVCPGCLNHTYGEQYGEHIQYIIKLQARIFTKMTHGSKRNITERRRILSTDEASTGATGGEVGLVFIFWLLLVLLIDSQPLGLSKAMIKASLSRLKVATQQVGENMTCELSTRKVDSSLTS
jgi:hypothetical protein